MIRVLIVGAGGHAQVVVDALWRSREAGGEAEPIGLVDDDETLLGRDILQTPVLGKINQISTIPHDALVIAIGDNAFRTQLFLKLKAAGEKFISAIHPTAIIAPDVSIAEGCMIMAGVIINTGSRVGMNTILNTGCTIDHHNQIGSHVHIAPGAHLGGAVSVGDGTLIGIGGIVMPQRTVGKKCVVGAGTLVTKNVPNRQLMIGVPGKSIAH